MKEILFRGKRVDNGEWVYGSYLRRTHPCIEFFCFAEDGVPEPDIAEVVPETVGQYTGLKDKNGAKIFGCDIVKDKKERTAVVKYGPFYPREYAAYPYNMYQQKIFGLYLEAGEKQLVIPEEPQVEVIGNIFDDSEFLN